MQYDVKTPEEYLKVIEDDWRKEKLLKIRKMLLAKAPDLEEQISYKMLGYCDAKGPVFSLNAQKNHVGFYVGNASKIDKDGNLLKGLNVGKGCVRIKKSIKLEDTQFEAFLDKAIELWRAGEDIDC